MNRGKIVDVQFNLTQDPDVADFRADRIVHHGRPVAIYDPIEAKPIAAGSDDVAFEDVGSENVGSKDVGSDHVARRFLKIPGVLGLVIVNNVCKVRKASDASWDVLSPTIIEAMQETWG
jgi:scaffold Nfu/NifU family protein